MRYSMFDCPAQSHTSPMATLSSTTVVSFASMVSVCDALSAVMAGNITFHFPSLSARVVSFRLPKITFTRSPGEAVPHTGTVCPCCNTMFDDSTSGIEKRTCFFTCAWQAGHRAIAKKRANNSLFMIVLIGFICKMVQI